MDREFGSRDGCDVVKKAEDLIAEFNKKCKEDVGGEEDFAAIAQTEDGQTAIVIVDPLMRQVHKNVPQSGEICLIDATSNLDRNDTKFFHLVCPSPIGALPLGEIICTREDAQTIQFGLELLQTVLPLEAFYGRGKFKGPMVFMTDDSDVERLALRRVWSEAELLICIFHILQAQ